MLSPDLRRSARSLEERLSLLHIASRRAAPSEWSVVPQAVRDRVPNWLRELLADYALLGAVLEYKDAKQMTLRLLRLFDPGALSEVLSDGSLLRRLMDYDLFPFAEESDGSVWIAPTGEAAGPIFLLELAAWDGDRPAVNNGVTFAGEKLEYVLSSMAISEASYYAKLPLPKYVMWYPGQGAERRVEKPEGK